MKKNIIVLALIIMLGWANLYAADGDLIVNGNIGVGITTPAEKFHVSGNAFISGDTFFYNKVGSQRGSVHYGPYGKIGQPYSYNWNPDNGMSGLWIEGSHDSESAGIFLNGNTMVLWSPGDNDILRVYDEDNIYPPFSSTQPFPLFVIDGAGNVGIRMTKSGWAYGYALNVSGTAYATGYWQASDINFKENIARIDSPLSKVLNMEGISFTWKQENDLEEEVPEAKYEGDEAEKLSKGKKEGKKAKRFPEGRHYGVVAQDVEKVMPEVVMEGTEGDKAVNYTELIPVLIEAIKEQQMIIEKQQEDIREIMMALEQIKTKGKQ